MYSQGAQSIKYLRHRDVKLKDKEERHEERTQHAMCEGICDRCRVKVQWKFDYGKYKRLTQPGSCRGCKQKCVSKAYRTYCDKCATKQRVCAACGGDTLKLNNERRAELEARGLLKDDEDSDEEEGSGGDEKEAGTGEAGEEDGEEDEEDGEESVHGVEAEEGPTLVAMPESVFSISDKDVRKAEAYGASKYDKKRVVGTSDDAALVDDLKKY